MNKAQLQILKDEINTDPLARGYSGMSNSQISDDINTEYRDLNRKTMMSHEVFNAIVKAEYNALADADKAMVWNILHMGEINPFGLESDIFTDIFGTGSQTITNLKNLRKQIQSRAAELGLPILCEGFVIDAKAL